MARCNWAGRTIVTNGAPPELFCVRAQFQPTAARDDRSTHDAAAPRDKSDLSGIGVYGRTRRSAELRLLRFPSKIHRLLLLDREARVSESQIV